MTSQLEQDERLRPNPNTAPVTGRDLGGESQPIEYVPPVYFERTVITVQPHNRSSSTRERSPMPVPTVSGWATSGDSFGSSSFIPLTGLQFLAGIEQLHIQQTVELHHLLAKIESENRYVVKAAGAADGETLYVGAETSLDWQRVCCGSGRAFTLTLVDPTQQQALYFCRRLACSSGILGCFLQRLDAYTPPGDFLGCVEQDWTLLIPRFVIRDEFSKQLFRLEGPRVCTCAMYNDATFQPCPGVQCRDRGPGSFDIIMSPVQVTSTETGDQVASISHSWDLTLVNYNLSVTFSSRHMENKQKALLVGAAFLLEYMFFERAKKAKCCSCF